MENNNTSKVKEAAMPKQQKSENVAGKITDVAETKNAMPKHHDAQVLPNQNPKFQDLLREHTDPKKLVGKNESQIEKALGQYYSEGNVKALQGFMKIYMYFPRPLVRKAEKYLDTLLDKAIIGAGHTKDELEKMNVNQLMKAGSGLGAYFDAGMQKEKMIKSILDMQALQMRRQKV